MRPAPAPAPRTRSISHASAGPQPDESVWPYNVRLGEGEDLPWPNSPQMWDTFGTGSLAKARKAHVLHLALSIALAAALVVGSVAAVSGLCPSFQGESISVSFERRG